jgi:hypothetical protein
MEHREVIKFLMTLRELALNILSTHSADEPTTDSLPHYLLIFSSISINICTGNVSLFKKKTKVN